MHVDGWLCEIKDVQIRDGLHVLGRPRRATSWSTWCWPCCGPTRSSAARSAACRVPGARRWRWAWRSEAGRDAEVDRVEALARDLVEAVADGRLGSAGCRAISVLRRRARPRASWPRLVIPWSSPAARSSRGCAGPATRSPTPCTPSTAASSRPDRAARRSAGWSTCCPPAATSTPSTRRRSRPGWRTRTGQAMAESLLRRHLDETGAVPAVGRPVGLGHLGHADQRRRHRRGAGPARCRPVWDDASRRVTGLGRSPGRAGPAPDRRHRPDLRLLPRRVPARAGDARRRRTPGRRPRRAVEDNYVRAHAQADLAEHMATGAGPTTRIFGSKPGAYGAGILPLMEAGNWRNDADLAEVYTAWGGFAYGRDLDGLPARGTWRPTTGGSPWRRRTSTPRARHRRLRRLLPVPRRDGGTVRALTGAEPKAYVGDSTTPDAVRTRR